MKIITKDHLGRDVIVNNNEYAQIQVAKVALFPYKILFKGIIFIFLLPFKILAVIVKKPVTQPSELPTKP